MANHFTGLAPPLFCGYIRDLFQVSKILFGPHEQERPLHQVGSQSEERKIRIEDRIIYIPNGVDTKQFRPSPIKTATEEIRDRRLYRSLSVGRLTPQSNPILCWSFHHEEKLGNVTLCIAGKGGSLRRQRPCGKWGYARFFSLVMWINRDLPDLYACSDYYIMTSK